MWVLPEAMRAELKEPLGPVVDTEGLLDAIEGPVLAIGDVVTQTLLEAGLVPKVSVIDGKTLREDDITIKAPPGATELQVKNPAASVTDELYEALVVGVSHPGPVLIRVDGEEDLAALPAVLLAPEGGLVCYGQPGEGVVLIRVDTAAREQVKNILDRMEVRSNGTRDDQHP